MSATVTVLPFAGPYVPELAAMERDIAIMERAIAIHDRREELLAQMQARSLTIMGCADTPAEIVALVAAKHSLDPGDILGESRTKAASAARSEAMWLLYERRHADGRRRWSKARIGHYFRRDHTSVIHALRRHEERMASVPPQHISEARRNG